ncbi:hypothetical protein SAMN05518672_10190 [Chitinophaga sp. CF118]|nr:hypothetical protein SAMN05518672_10190 [Chitinophaga sp. CF118]
MYLKTIVICLTLGIAGFKPSFAQHKKGLLWEISGKGMTKPAYLFGTVHLYDTSSYYLPEAPFALLDKVKKVYFEVDFGHINTNDIMEAMFITDTTQTIDKLLDAASLAKLKQMAAVSATLKMFGDKMYSLKPIFLQTILMNNDGKASSVDMELYKAAINKKDSVGGLETIKEQMDAINAISIPVQTDMLRQSLLKNMSSEQMLSQLTAIYVKQDIENMLNEINDDMPLDANFNEVLLIKRNVVIADRIDALLRKESPLIAVGGGHLGTETGLIALLQKKGYTLKNIPFTINKKH